MKFTTSLFSQILQVIPRASFLRLVHECGAERHAKGFSSWDQYVAMLFCQLAQSKSLREISDGLAVRLTGEELTRLRDIAARRGLGPSTYARLLLTQAIQREDYVPRVVASDELLGRLSSSLSRIDEGKLESLVKDVAAGDPDIPLALIFAGKKKDWEESTLLFLKCLLGLLGVRVVTAKRGNPHRMRLYSGSNQERQILKDNR